MINPVITAWSAVSPYGMGKKALLDGLRVGRPAPAGTVPEFSPRETLGKQGTKAMDRSTALAVSATGLLLEETDVGGSADTGVVLATTYGSVQSMSDFTRSSLTGAKPYHVDPAAIPFLIMNSAAGRCAIWYGLKGPNATLAAGRPSGLVAFGYARRLLRAGRARTVLCGAAEEYSATRSRLHTLVGGGDATLGEGCVMFAVTADPGAPAIASIRAVSSRFCAGTDWAGALRAAVGSALSTSGTAPDAVWAVAPSGAAGPAGEAEQAVAAALFPAARALPPLTDLVGETHSVSAMFQLAAVLAQPGHAGRVAVLTSTDPAGCVTAAVVGCGDDISS